LKLCIKMRFFGLREIEYLGYIVSGGKIPYSTQKVNVVRNWLVPTTQREVRNFFAKFMHYYSNIQVPLTDLPWKLQPHKVTFTPTCLEAFETLKFWLIIASCMFLQAINSDATFTVSTYA
jgi:hypothetical protein